MVCRPPIMPCAWTMKKTLMLPSESETFFQNFQGAKISLFSYSILCIEHFCFWGGGGYWGEGG